MLGIRRGAVAGLLAAGTALGVGQFVAGLTGASGSPVVAVGELQIDLTPPWLKNWAIAEFGANDKTILVSGIVVVLAVFAAVIGVLATRRLAYGMAGLAVFAVVGLTAAVTRPGASVASLLPTLAAVAAAAAVLRFLIPLAGPPPVQYPPAWLDDPVTPTLSEDGPSAGEDGGGELGPGDLVPGDLVPGDLGPGDLDGADHGVLVQPRRSFVKASIATIGVAAGAELAGRVLAERGSVATAQKSLRLPPPVSSSGTHYGDEGPWDYKPNTPLVPYTYNEVNGEFNDTAAPTNRQDGNSAAGVYLYLETDPTANIHPYDEYFVLLNKDCSGLLGTGIGC